ncbi:EF-P 5-aminopentanol modification-associated protein YfmH [Virgibacillus sp. MG-45]|uniref:EF-P 5-aminopentanol modification-associated protein YfmH n=1 Tax=Virgibacillus sp. MG-45 TaxID=3102791 RepID=UPI002EDA61BF
MHKKHYDYINETIYSETLPNGLTVSLMPKETMSKTYSIFTTDYGSIDQTFTPLGSDEKVTVPEGVAHFLEHKLFEKEDRDVFSDFSKLGASANAFTSFTKTAYLFSATNHIEENVTILLDFVQEPYFSEASVEKEKGIIAQEINMYDDQPEWQSFMGTIRAMFQNHPVHIDIAGTVPSIQSITKDDLYTCYRTFYHPENMYLFVAGNFNPDNMIALIKENQAAKEFASLEEIKRDYPSESRTVAMEDYTIHMPVSIPKCTVGIKESVDTLHGIPFLKRDLLQEMIVTHYFSKGGPFYQALYNENLIDESFYVETNLDKNFGYTLIGGNTRTPAQFANRVKELLLSTQQATLLTEDVERMKKKKIGQMLRAMNSLEFIANKYTHYQMVGVDLFDIIPEIQKITAEEVNRFLNNWIEKDRLSVCTIESE